MQNFKIAIKFGDNDFHSTFKGVLAMLFDAFKYQGELPEDKQKLCFIINKLSPIAYITHQNTWEYNGLENATGFTTEQNEEYTRIEKYLQITPDRILLNKEVDKLIEEGNEIHCFNCEIFVLDTSLFCNNIYSL